MRRTLLALMVCLAAACGKTDERVAHVVLPAAEGLREGAMVRYRGIQIGTVTTVQFVDSGIRVDLAISRADAPLRSGDQVRVAPAGIFGDREVEIVPGPVKAPRLGSNGWLAATPPDSLAQLRGEVMQALILQRLGQLATRDSVATAQRRADSLHPPGAPSRAPGRDSSRGRRPGSH